MKKWQKILLLVGTHVLVAVLAVALTFVVFLRKTDGMSKLQQIYMLIQDRYVGQVDEQYLFDMAATGMVAGTGDRWSYYVSAEDMDEFNSQKDNRFVGIGVTIQGRDDGAGIEIMRVQPNSPALEAGLQAGDVIIKVEGQLVSEIGMDGASDKIAGKEGTQVNITVLRGDQELDFTMTRRTIIVEVAQGQLLENGIGYIRIANFNSYCAQQTIEQIESLLQQGATGFVFDVRYNGGGYVSELVELLDYLLPEGMLFISEYYDGTRQVDTSDAGCLEMPMVVLVNESSYSAAEFFPAALREYGWAQIVGTPTVGKGNFQETYMLADGSAVALSVGRYYTPNGVSLADEGGLVPDLVVEVDDQTAGAIYSQTLPLEEDPQLQAALTLFE